MNTPGDLIPDLLQEFKDMGKSLETEIYNICLFSKGGITREEGFRLSSKERKAIIKIIKSIKNPG